MISRRWLHTCLILKMVSVTLMQLPPKSGCLSRGRNRCLVRPRCPVVCCCRSHHSFPVSKAVLPARWDLCGTPVAIAWSLCLVSFAHGFDEGGSLCNIGLKDCWGWTILQMNQQFLTPPCWDSICLLRREAADFFVTWLNSQNSGNTCSLFN